MNKNHFMAIVFIAATTMLVALPALAISVTDFEKLDAKGQTDAYQKIVDDYTAQAYHVNQQTGDAVTDYFATIPPGASLPLGYTAFDARLRSTLKTASQADKDDIQIENIIALGVKEDVLDKLAKQSPATNPKSPQSPSGAASTTKSSS